MTIVENRGPDRPFGRVAVEGSRLVPPDSALTAWDTGRGILSRWSSAGDLLNEARPPVSHWGPDVHDAPDRLVTVTSETSGSAMQQALVEVTVDDTTPLHTVPRAMVRAEIPCTTRPVPRLFSPSVVWTVRAARSWSSFRRAAT